MEKVLNKLVKALAVFAAMLVIASSLALLQGPAHAQGSSGVCGLSRSDGSYEQQLTAARNIRTGPSTSCSKVGVMGTGINVTVSNSVLGAEGKFRWTHVESSAGSGWIAYMRADGSNKILIDAKDEGSSGTSVCGSSRPGGSANMELTKARNIRTGPSLDCGRVGVLKAGVPVATTNWAEGDGYRWTHVETSAGSGWIAFARADGSNDVLIAAGSGSDSSGVCGRPRPADGGVRELTTARNIRTGPSLECARVGTLKAGVDFTRTNYVRGDGYRWTHVDTPAGSGWVAYAREDGSGNIMRTPAKSNDRSTPSECGNQSVVDCYAPILKYKTSEDYFPYDPATFVVNMKLRFINSRSCYLAGSKPSGINSWHYLTVEKDLTNDKLETGYRLNAGAKSSCNPTSTNQSTELRPYSHRDTSGKSVGRAGLFMESKVHQSAFANKAPMSIYALASDANYIEYWMFYAYDPKSYGLGAGAAHFGDWEHITVYFDNGFAKPPTDLEYWGHGCVLERLSWDGPPRKDATKAGPATGRPEIEGGTHPVVYVAEGSHASYGRADLTYGIGKDTGLPFTCAGDGRKGTGDVTSSRGVTFDTSSQPILRLDTQPWYDYAGAWGDVDTTLKVGELKTGPSGPKFSTGKSYKNLRPKGNPTGAPFRAPS